MISKNLKTFIVTTYCTCDFQYRIKASSLDEATDKFYKQEFEPLNDAEPVHYGEELIDEIEEEDGHG